MLYYVVLSLFVMLLLYKMWSWSRVGQMDELYDEKSTDIDDLQGSKKMGIRINGVRQLQIEAGGLRFTPGGSSTRQSLLQQFFVGQVDLGGWRIGTVPLSANTLLESIASVQRIGNQVMLQVRTLGLTSFGLTSRAGTTIVSELALPTDLLPQTRNVYAFLIDETKRTDPSFPNLALCVASIDSSGKLQIQRYNQSSSMGAPRGTISLSSFTLQYLLD